jgi:hypothetical protein
MTFSSSHGDLPTNMCTLHYILYACGHSSYRYSSATSSACRPDNVCVKPLLEDGHNRIHDSTALKTMCPLCETGLSDPTKDPYLKNLRGICNLLERELDLVEDEEGKLVQRAREAVHLLNRMARSYWACSDSRPDPEELRGYITFAAESIEKIAQEKRRRDAQRRTPSPMAMGVSYYPPTYVPYQHTTFSQGTIDRQLGDLSLMRTPAASMRQYSVYYPGAYPSYMVSWTPSTNNYHMQSLERPVYPSAWEVLDNSVPPQVSTPMTEEHDDGSVYMNHNIQSHGFSSHLSRSSSPELQSLPSAVGAPPVKTYMDGRDDWACDFCGPECFCWHLDD